MRRRASRRARRPRRGGGRAAPVGWIALIALTVAVVVGGIVLLGYFKPPVLDEATLCPKRTGPVAGTVILLDLTDPLARAQAERLRGALARVVRDAPTHALIAVGAVRTDPARRGAGFALCKPLAGHEANELYRNPRLVGQRYRENFEAPLDAMIGEMLAAGTEPRSPILESLQAVLAGAPGFLGADYPRRVVLVSDLLQNSAAFSFYRGENWRSFRQSPDFSRLADTLGGVDMTIYRIPRPGANVDLADVDDFWVNYFDRAGVASVTVRSLGDL